MVHHRQRQLRNILKRRLELCKIDIDEYVWVLKSTFYVNDGISFLNLRFENDVEMYGTQTRVLQYRKSYEFENDVEMYGTQTPPASPESLDPFENDVEMYGTQTGSPRSRERGTFENDVEMYGTQTVTFPLTCLA